MSIRRHALVSLALSLAASSVVAVGCGPDEETPSTPDPSGQEGERVHGLTEAQRAEVLATIGDETVTVGEFAEELASKGAYIRTRYNSPERRREFLDQMIRFELLAQEARRRGYHELPEVQRTRKQRMIRRFLEERFENGGPEAIPDEDVRAFYEEHTREFNTPDQVRASHILFRDRAAAERVLRELQAAPADLRLYRRLAEQHNTDPETRDRFGDLQFFSRVDERAESERELPEALVEAAFGIERLGGLHDSVIRTSEGYHILKLTGRRDGTSQSLEEAERSIRSRLHRERREAAIASMLEELRGESDVEENLEVLDAIQIELPGGDAPTITDPRLQGGPR